MLLFSLSEISAINICEEIEKINVEKEKTIIIKPSRNIENMKEDNFCSLRFSSVIPYELQISNEQICQSISDSSEFIKIQSGKQCRILTRSTEVNLRIPVSSFAFEISILLISDFSSFSESRLRRATFAAQRSSQDADVAAGPDEKTLDWAVYIVVFVLVILPVGAIFYCACQSQMHAATHGITASQPPNQMQIGATGKTISQQPITTAG
ncbi:unnamed protein product [Oikopleura dioica]|uniref:Uncharacterized protein n=1 Tax=Oikopleura dioica TaxID=34765 RepID=E4XM76_OIKDI|nr:unnamed protein product [Oikopleura dioica]